MNAFYALVDSMLDGLKGAPLSDAMSAVLHGTRKRRDVWIDGVHYLIPECCEILITIRYGWARAQKGEGQFWAELLEMSAAELYIASQKFKHEIWPDAGPPAWSQDHTFPKN